MSDLTRVYEYKRNIAGLSVIVPQCWNEHGGTYANVGIKNGKSIRYRKIFVSDGGTISYPGYVYPYPALSGEMDDPTYENFLHNNFDEIIELIDSLID